MELMVLEKLRSLNRWIAILTGIFLLACVCLVLLDIVLRRLGSSFGGTDEISGYVMAIATSWGMAFTLLEAGHVRIDILRSRTGRVGRSVFDLFSMLVLSSTITLIAVRCWPCFVSFSRKFLACQHPFGNTACLGANPLVRWLGLVRYCRLVDALGCAYACGEGSV